MSQSKFDPSVQFTAIFAPCIEKEAEAVSDTLRNLSLDPIFLCK